MKILLLLILASCAAGAQTTNVTFTWDPSPPASGQAYRFYEKVGQSRVFLGTAQTNFFTVSNWVVGASRTMTVTCTNTWGESAESAPWIMGTSPTAPPNLKPVPLSLIAPMPGTIEFSHDLAVWMDRLQLLQIDAMAVQCTFKLQPGDPMLFARVKQPFQPAARPSFLP
jgi:hypothetical protein